jgi:hypothetical protein
MPCFLVAIVSLLLIALVVRKSVGMKRRFVVVILSLGLIGVLLLALIGAPVPFELLWNLVFGWVAYCWRVLPKVRLNVSALLTAAGCLMGLGVGLHLFLRWFYSQWKTTTPSVRRWPVRWTAMVLALVVLMFVAGIASVGVTHQTAWLVTSPEPVSQFPASFQRTLDHVRARDIQWSEPDTIPTSSPAGSVDAP